MGRADRSRAPRRSTEFRVEAAPSKGRAKSAPVKIAKATADINLPEAPLDTIYDDKSGRKRNTGPVSFAIDGKDETAWGIDVGPGRRNQPRQAVFVPRSRSAFPGGASLTFTLVQNHGGWNSDDNQNNNLGRFRLSITSAPEPAADLVPRDVRAILAVPRDKRTAAQVNAVFSYWRTTVPEWKEANAQIEALWRQHPEGTTQLALHEREGKERRATHVLERGDFLKPEQAGRARRSCVPEPAAWPGHRRRGCRLPGGWWIGDAPTTARSIVNRVWQAYFGTGIVATSEDLGMQCEPPSHPELLDWLAVEFMESGWSLKHLHRLIATSATYRQSSRVTPELIARDPYNRLLARGPRFRVDAEVVRDIALAASGLLYHQDRRPERLRPPRRRFCFSRRRATGPRSGPRRPVPTDTAAHCTRSAIARCRTPCCKRFDAPNGDFACVRRARSNTPLQALTTLNEPIFLECARALALLTVRAGGSTDSDRLILRLSPLRSLDRPRSREMAVLLDLLHRADAPVRPTGGQALGPGGQSTGAGRRQLPPGATPAQLAGWTAVVARALESR